MKKQKWFTDQLLDYHKSLCDKIEKKLDEVYKKYTEEEEWTLRLLVDKAREDIAKKREIGNRIK